MAITGWGNFRPLSALSVDSKREDAMSAKKLDAAIDALVDALAELPEHELEGWQRGTGWGCASYASLVGAIPAWCRRRGGSPQVGLSAVPLPVRRLIFDGRGLALGRAAPRKVMGGKESFRMPRVCRICWDAGPLPLQQAAICPRDIWFRLGCAWPWLFCSADMKIAALYDVMQRPNVTFVIARIIRKPASLLYSPRICPIIAYGKGLTISFFLGHAILFNDKIAILAPDISFAGRGVAPIAP